MGIVDEAATECLPTESSAPLAPPVVPGKFEHLSLTHAQRIDLIKTCFGSLDVAEKKTCLKDLFLSSDNQTEQQLLSVLTDIYDKTTQNTSLDVLCNTLDTLFLKLSIKAGITSNPGNFSSLSIQAMKLLQNRGRSNLVYKFSQMLTDKKQDNTPLISMDRMPFGLIDYAIQFMTSTHIRQVSKEWYHCR